MFDLLTDPIFWGALMALFGVIVGQIVSGWSKKKDFDLSAIQATVEVLRAEVQRLNSEVGELRSKWDRTEKRYRQLTEKFSASMAWIAAARVWEGSWFATLDEADAAQHPRLPPLPELIASDLPTSSVEPIDDAA